MCMCMLAVEQVVSAALYVVGSAHVSEAIMHQLEKQDGFVVDSTEGRMMVSCGVHYMYCV